MGTASPSPTLNRLRKSLAGLDSSLAPRFAGDERLLHLNAPIDGVLGGGLACGALHELAPAAASHAGAASGFALALAALASTLRGPVLWIGTGFAANEAGTPYGPGFDGFGLSSAQLVVLQVPRTADVLWAMEEALRCRALACTVAELAGGDAGLTATRRLVLAARDGGGLGLLLRHRATPEPSAAATRWEIAAQLSRPDAYGGLGAACFQLSLCKNRRGPCGRWIVTWDHHERTFHAAVSVGVAAAALDRSDRAPSVGTG